MTRILRVKAERLDVAMKKPFGISGGAQELARNVLVRLEADGVVGLGEGAPFPAFNGETQADVLASCAALSLEGLELDDTASIRARLASASPSARCAIETAVVDARGRARGISLHAYFGGATTTLTTDITITTGSVEDAEREARDFAAFAHLKVKVGGSSVAHDVARIRAIRVARPDAKLLVDANAGFTLADARAFAAAIGDIAWFEQPVRGWEDVRAFIADAPMPVVLDESIASAADVELAAAAGARAVNIKIMKSGIFEALAIAERAKAAGLALMIGGMVETRLAMGTSACIAAGLGGFTIVDLDTPLFLASDPFTGGYVYEGDQLDLAPIKAGHGIDVR